MSRTIAQFIPCLLCAVLCLSACSPSTSSSNQNTANSDVELQQEIAALEQAIASAEVEVQRLESINTLENIAGIYSYYVDKFMHDDVADLFAEDATLEIFGRGLFIGQDRIRAYMHTLDPVGPRQGGMFNHMQLQPIITLSEDGNSAQMRSRIFVMTAIADAYDQWGEGIYENEYVNDHGVWKIKKLMAYQDYYTFYQDGWARNSLPRLGLLEHFPPDQPPTVNYQPYPAAFVAPFHYQNPVSPYPSRPANP